MTTRFNPWWSMSREETARAVESDATRGLMAEEAARRLERDGFNELAEKPPAPVWLKFLRQFTDITVLALIAAALVASLTASLHSAPQSVIERFRDAIAIGLIVIINALIGFFQERKAERALQALKQLGAPLAHVVRGGRTLEVPAKQLVVGDLVELYEGDRVPADIRLVRVADLAIDESALTGESVAVDKSSVRRASDTALAERLDMAYLGTHIVRGRGAGLVVAIGRATELGKIAELLEEVERPHTPLQERLKRFGLHVVLVCALIGLGVFLIGMLRQHADPSVLLLTAVSLAVAVIPEGLPAITTIVLALGVERMAKKHALIRRLPAVESLGAATVICTDKTGTLTQNRMRVRELWCAGVRRAVGELDAASAAFGSEEARAACARLLAAAAYAPAHEDPTDRALLELFVSARPVFELPDAEAPLVTLPFDNRRRMASVVVDGGAHFVSFSHGAPETLIERSTRWLSDSGERALDASARERVLREVEQLAASGLRVIGVATGTVPKPGAGLPERSACECELLFLGLLGLADPPRPEVKASLALAEQAGVRTIMITGDHPTTARAIAEELGILGNGRVVSGADVESLSPDELSNALRDVRVVARASAEHKLRLVEALRGAAAVVAMTGDGVNDAPAIKAADIGVAMGPHATDVTREAASMVVYDGSYSTIVDAIAEGRTTYQNIKRFILFLFTVNLSLVIAVCVASILGLPPILTPTEILWINLITNGLPALALGMEPKHEDPMQRPPRDPQEPILRAVELVPVVSYGALMGALGLLVFVTLAPTSLHLARTAAFTLLALAPLFHAFNSRSRWASVWQLGFWSNGRLWGAFVLALGLQAIAVYVPGAHLVFDTEPLPVATLLALLGISALVWVVGELHKAVLRRFRSKRRLQTGNTDSGASSRNSAGSGRRTGSAVARSAW